MHVSFICMYEYYQIILLKTKITKYNWVEEQINKNIPLFLLLFKVIKVTINTSNVSDLFSVYYYTTTFKDTFYFFRIVLCS